MPKTIFICDKFRKKLQELLDDKESRSVLKEEVSSLLGPKDGEASEPKEEWGEDINLAALGYGDDKKKAAPTPSKSRASERSPRRPEEKAEGGDAAKKKSGRRRGRRKNRKKK